MKVIHLDAVSILRADQVPSADELHKRLIQRQQALEESEMLKLERLSEEKELEGSDNVLRDLNSSPEEVEGIYA